VTRTDDRAKPLRAYVSGALTGAERADAHDLYEAAAEVLRAHGLTAYVPHMATDPVMHPTIAADAVYQRDRSEVVTADLVVAFVGRPSFGVGMELELAAAALVPILLVIPEGFRVSRMVTGGAARVYGPVSFSDTATLRTALERALPDIAAELRLRERPPVPEVGRRFRELRISADLTIESVARELGVSAPYIEMVEAAPALVSNPSITFLGVAAHLFAVPLADLLVRSGTDESRVESLRLYAVERALTFAEYSSLERLALENPRAFSFGATEWDRLREAHALAQAGLTQLELLPSAN
jgi:transcriptional regulator with XRE-family HTH domain